MRIHGASISCYPPPLLVQLAERLTVNQKVAGSNPAKRNSTCSSVG